MSASCLLAPRRLDYCNESAAHVICVRASRKARGRTLSICASDQIERPLVINSNTSLSDLYRRLSSPWKADWFAIPIRLIVGYGFMEHGYAKIAHGPAGFANILDALGVPFPDFMAWATIVIELLGGFAVLVVALVPLATGPMIVVLLVAIFTVHTPNGFSSIKLQSVDAAGAHFGQPGYETDLLYMGGIFALLLGGVGPWALDRVLFKRC
jgi:putative oxidoreductase